MEAAALVISHAGSGSLFEGLALRKAIVAVPNPVLMANHQAELAEKLAADGCVVVVLWVCCSRGGQAPGGQHGRGPARDAAGARHEQAGSLHPWRSSRTCWCHRQIDALFVEDWLWCDKELLDTTRLCIPLIARCPPRATQLSDPCAETCSLRLAQLVPHHLIKAHHTLPSRRQPYSSSQCLVRNQPAHSLVSRLHAGGGLGSKDPWMVEYDEAKSVADELVAAIQARPCLHAGTNTCTSCVPSRNATSSTPMAVPKPRE